MIYAPAQSAVRPASTSASFANAAFTLERAACALFGLTTYGVHMTGRCFSTGRNLIRQRMKVRART